MEALPSPLSSRAKPRDLQFSGPFLGMFFDRIWVLLCVFVLFVPGHLDGLKLGFVRLRRVIGKAL